jgi:hypothetical protein
VKNTRRKHVGVSDGSSDERNISCADRTSGPSDLSNNGRHFTDQRTTWSPPWFFTEPAASAQPLDRWSRFDRTHRRMYT